MTESQTVFYRLTRIFARYADENLRLCCNCLAPNSTGLAQIDELRLDRNRLVVEGWTEADRIGLRLNRATVWVVPDLAHQSRTARGFTVDIPFEPGTPQLLMFKDSAETALSLPGFSRARVNLARLWLWLPYLRTLMALVPHIWRWKRRGDLVAREVVKERLGLVSRSDAAEMSDAVLSPAIPPVQRFKTVTVVMPVYNAFDLMVEALDRAERHADLPLRIIVVEDCSTDPRVRLWLVAWAQSPDRKAQVHLILNDVNLGFIGAVNRGFASARARPNDPVVLLNSDALLPAGWTSRLIAPLADPQVASVTPMSNDAEIFTVPAPCRPIALHRGEADRLDAAARLLHPTAGLVHAPTGVGFCMALAPQFLAQVPTFDTGFGRGYGEETDWCQRIRALGGLHLGTPNLFVEHRGGRSFGAAAKQALLQTNGAIISGRYPAYDAEVQRFIRQDPMVTARLALGLTWAAGRQVGQAVPVWLAHAMGGGADNDLKRRIARETEQGRSAVVLRVGQGHRWKLELHTPFGVTQGLTNDITLIRRLIARLPERRVIYSCGVGDRDPATLPALLLDLAGRGANPIAGGVQGLEVLMHDFFPVSPSYTLLGANGAYHGPPRAGTPAADDPAHRIDRPGLPAMSLQGWQNAWRQLMQAADKITVFSDSSRAILAQVWPETAARTVVTPHHLLATIPRVVPPVAGGPVIGVLGNIGLHKGAGVVQQLSRDLARDPRAKLVVIGQLDPAFKLDANTTIHGNYERRDLPTLVARYGISGWLIPSIWPETFSFTTHEAIATGLPVFCFDLGGQADALRASLAVRGRGGLLPLDGSYKIEIERLLQGLNAPHPNPAIPSPPPAHAQPRKRRYKFAS
ncbi:glycosyltransferase [Pseudorhodobacter ferrugineus]|uniref:glycosyltransferase n=1 Tax=Pseudorhodobacter ferrugineus TaxID=77008 RepID=UPI0003B4F770|nr:glycosyltransferase [Pseudorhodobacter ferrugineus]